MIKLSFIVPIYNVKDYLEKCVLSLVHQDYQDYEIILVDDGSTDQSGQLADQLVDEVRGKREEGGGKSVQIRVIHQQNKGLSGARNTGVEAAKGEYVCFVDSDDYWEPNVLESLMEQVERDSLDVLRFRWQNVREVRGKREEVRTYEVFQPYKEANAFVPQNEVVTGEKYLSAYMGIRCYAVMNIVRLEICRNERFTERIYLEDVDWTPRMLLAAKRVGETDKVVYNYLWRFGSITLTNNLEKKHKMLQDQLYVLNRMQALRQNDNIAIWCRRVQAVIVRNFLDSICKNCYAERTNWCQQLREIGVLPLQQTETRWKAKLKVWLINWSPMLYIRIFRKL